MSNRTRGSISKIIRNDACLYEGNLVVYFRTIFNKARNLRYGYHNFRHIFHVTGLCYQACLFYRNKLTRREIRNLLIAAMFHDFDHLGLLGDDDLNIAKAIRGLERHILDQDRPNLPDIVLLIKATEYPYKVPSVKLELSAQIIRDCDLSQSLSVAWIQQVVFGLAEEWGKKPIEVLRMQESYLDHLNFETEWARKMFPKSDVAGKIKEAQEILELLDGESSASI